MDYANKVFKITSDRDYKVTDEFGFHLKTISEYDDFIFYQCSEKQAKDSFKNIIHVKRFPKCFTIEDITPPCDNQLHTIRGNDNMVYIFLNGEKVMSWYDGANCDWPEDLTWDREISAVFQMGIDIGIKLAE